MVVPECVSPVSTSELHAAPPRPSVQNIVERKQYKVVKANVYSKGRCSVAITLVEKGSRHERLSLQATSYSGFNPLEEPRDADGPKTHKAQNTKTLFVLK